MKSFAVSVFCALVYGQAIDNPCSNVELLRVGQFHEDETGSKWAGDWYGFYETTDGGEFRKVSVHIDRAFDPIVDESEEDSKSWTGWAVTIEGKGEEDPRFLLRGAETLKEGAVATWYSGYVVVMPGSPLSAEGHEASVALKADGKASAETGLVENYVLTLVVQDKSVERAQTVLSSERIDSENAITVLCIADFDRDGKPDLLIDTGNHYNVTEYSLYLSSCADDGKLVALAAKFRAVGC